MSMWFSHIASTNCRAVPAGESSAAIQTLLSITSRSAFICEQLPRYVLAHTLGSCIFADAAHRLTQTLARHLLAPRVALGRNHYYGRTTIASDADRLPLGS